MTTEIAKKNGIPEGYMKDRKGRLVPIEQVSPFDIEMDAFVRAQDRNGRLCSRPGQRG